LFQTGFLLRESENFGRFSASFHPISPARMQPFIKYLRIENYKSIDKLELHDMPPFAVFAGANGSGKSNFFDALEFVSQIAQSDVEVALRKHQGFANMHCVKRYKSKARTFEFDIQVFLQEHHILHIVQLYHKYRLKVTNLDTTPVLEEDYYTSPPTVFPPMHKRLGSKASLQYSQETNTYRDADINFSSNVSFLRYLETSLTETIRGSRIYRIDPISAKRESAADADNSELDRSGNNLASVLRRLEQDENIRDTIMEFLSLYVPNLEKVSAHKQKLTSHLALSFKESNTKKEFPAHLISDGTIYLLNLLVAVLDVKKRTGITMIEEPERGLHPEAISQIVAFMRERATSRNPIWLTTHSEAVVRATQEGDLFFVEKEDGRTVIKPALPYTNGSFSRDRAWLSNALGGGLPW
jgi:predicted ATPase